MSLHEDVRRAELAALVARHRYGIHGMSEEHFGMAVAEMVRAGCVVFVPRGGGQGEIVEGDERLLYSGREEAAAKIAQTMSDEGRQTTPRKVFAGRKPLFTTQSFMASRRENLG